MENSTVPEALAVMRDTAEHTCQCGHRDDGDHLPADVDPARPCVVSQRTDVACRCPRFRPLRG